MRSPPSGAGPGGDANDADELDAVSSLGDALLEARLPQAPGGHGPLGEPLEPGLDASPAWVSQTRLAELFDDGLGLVIATEQFLRIALEGAAANPLTHGSPLRFPGPVIRQRHGSPPGTQPARQ